MTTASLNSPCDVAAFPVHHTTGLDTQHTCRFCNSTDLHSVVDLGLSPLCESFVREEDLQRPELFYPLHAFVCAECFLVQVPEFVSGEEIFGGEYAYFSSFSDAWLRHAADYVAMITDRLGLTHESKVVEIASNDGYLLKNFVAREIPCLGVEPADNVAATAIEKGVPTTVRFFGTQTAQELRDEGTHPDLMIANNCLAHVPDLNDFVAGFKILLNEDGVLTVEFPHLMHIIEENHFDTIYQEHYCYLSLLTVDRVFQRHGLTIFDVEEIWTHGGSLRIYARHTEDTSKPLTPAVTEILERERTAGLDRLETYEDFAERVEATKRNLLEFLIEAKRDGKSVVGYGAPGKGNTLLNYCGVSTDFLDYTVDRNPFKHGKYLPGSRIPVFATERIAETRPDYILILPWNLRDEIATQLEYTKEWGCQLIVPIPALAVVD